MSLSALGHLKFVQSEETVGWMDGVDKAEASKVHENLLIKWPVHHGKELDSEPEGNREPQQGLRREVSDQI